ncbi:exosome complex component RRP4 homolog [Nymphaea colorata]|nr:exosome complex component RRP4 homolog [Nymphaea colorata]
MRDLELSLNQGQRVRLKKALQQLQDCSSKVQFSAPVTVADTIPVNQEDGVLKGHGTSELNGEVVATVCGLVERVNKLVLVRPFRSRYKPEIGDIIVGRVIEVAPKRWKLEINFSQDAVLMLSSMNLPDGIQRRRTALDELNMRTIFEENDVICAEVRGFQHDGSLHLQARSEKYGKLEKGLLLTVSPYLVKRRKQHFHFLEQFGVDLILGCNGFIWVGGHAGSEKDYTIEEEHSRSDQNNKSCESSATVEDIPLTVRENICRIANAVRILSELGFYISMEVIMDAVEASIGWNFEIRDMLGAEFYVRIAEREAQRRKSQSKKKI